MTATEAAELIEAMAASLKANPAQFHIEINMTGQQAMNTGGIGFSATAIGGGPGSTTIGNQVTLDGAHIQIAQKRAGQAFDQQVHALLQTMQDIAKELRSATPDRSLVRRAMDSLKNTWVPGIIIGVIGTAVSKSLGL